MRNRAGRGGLVAIGTWALFSSALVAMAEPQLARPDLEEIFDRVTPHFHHSAGSPIPGLTRGEATYSGEGFVVGKPEMVMPTGAGKLSAMVAYGDRLELLLSDTEYFNAIADNGSGAVNSHVNPLLSPGRIEIELGEATAKDILKFDQWIDFARGAVIVELETREGKVRAEVGGDMKEDNLVISVRDFRRDHRAATIRYENWRDSMVIGAGAGTLTGVEAVDPAGVRGWKAQSMSLALKVGCVDGASFPTASAPHQGSIVVPRAAAGNFVVVIAAQCAHGQPPLVRVQSSWSETAGAPTVRLEAAKLKWWKDFWVHSWLDLHGPGADYLARLWYTTLYSYACVGQGAVPPKFNGGPGLVFKDARSWGDGYWWQNQREISFWPMAAAGHAEFTRRSILFFNQAFATSRNNATSAKLAGLWFREGNRPRDWSLPFGAECPLIAPGLEAFAPAQIAPADALAVRAQTKAGYNALNFSSGIEFVQAIFDYVQYAGDAELAQKIGAPWLKGETLMSLGLLTAGQDGRFHVRCADATEQWWKVDDSAPLLAGIRYILTLTVKQGRALGFESGLIAAAQAGLSRLAPLPTVAAWDYRTEKPGNFWFCAAEHVVPGDTLLAPFRLAAGIRSHNGENPELYAVFPFGLIDLNSAPADLERARRTFAHRFFKNTAGWSQGPVQAARLGLPDTLAVILDHAARQQKWPYGGWNSPAGSLYPGSAVGDCPFFDAAGVNMTALQESLLQSQAAVGTADLMAAGVIRLIPAVSKRWSGGFLLNARGGFAVTVDFAQGKLNAAVFEASRAARLRVLNPFRRAAVWQAGKRVSVRGKIITREMKGGERVTLADWPE